ncbi:hypothetical protein PVAP13_5NG135881 [Panicum virgatum]|uniref:Uncharacterized protein n=1 Tax=Panicum virgatum TaxID=38727 RepID=A0A8T0RRD9_PANVG|nr:hypothetical protein PVAP13_5NG135881 [Panicum virgatum]
MAFTAIYSLFIINKSGGSCYPVSKMCNTTLQSIITGFLETSVRMNWYGRFLLYLATYHTLANFIYMATNLLDTYHHNWGT